MPRDISHHITPAIHDVTFSAEDLDRTIAHYKRVTAAEKRFPGVLQEVLRKGDWMPRTRALPPARTEGMGKEAAVSWTAGPAGRDEVCGARDLGPAVARGQDMVRRC